MEVDAKKGVISFIYSNECAIYSTYWYCCVHLRGYLAFENNSHSVYKHVCDVQWNVDKAKTYTQQTHTPPLQFNTCTHRKHI